ncbi:hypothetical protein SteCoe_13841 [Stentor coeruleus]|uniref:Uncharacterized protein n=1 Tax=Stentor coeruleus TaxID=5963 RepID=A0A1R2C7M4_9CILI|nr:hypothetical protein SteCoe_13841 [Stentor coeruleus]
MDELKDKIQRYKLLKQSTLEHRQSSELKKPRVEEIKEKTKWVSETPMPSLKGKMIKMYKRESSYKDKKNSYRNKDSKIITGEKRTKESLGSLIINQAITTISPNELLNCIELDSKDVNPNKTDNSPHQTYFPGLKSHISRELEFLNLSPSLAYQKLRAHNFSSYKKVRTKTRDQSREKQRPFLETSLKKKRPNMHLYKFPKLLNVSVDLLHVPRPNINMDIFHAL